MKTFDELIDYAFDEANPIDIVCEKTSDGGFQIRCLGDEEILVSSEDVPEYKFAGHVGHDIRVTLYGNDDVIWNVSIECMDCYEVIADIDNPDLNATKDT